MQSFEQRRRAQAAAAVIGVDAGKFKHALVVRPRGDRDSRPLEFPTSRAGFESATAYILGETRRAVPDATPADVLVGIEFAGSYGFTFAHYLHARGFPIVTVLPSDTKRWKEVTHHQALKTDQKDAQGIVDLASQGHFVAFAFLQPVYAELRYLVSTRERFSLQRRALLTRLKSTLELVWPEFERVFPAIQKRTPLAVLGAYPSPATFLAAQPSAIRAVLATASRNHHVATHLVALTAAARDTLGLPLAEGAPAREVPLLLAQLRLLTEQLQRVEAEMTAALARTPEGKPLLTIPGVAPVTAATFLGSVGDPQAYASSRQILALAGLALVESSSGTHKGKERLSKRGRPVLRRHAFLLALRCVRQGGLFRTEYDAMLARNGGIAFKALTAVSRRVLKVMFTVARERRAFVAAHISHGVEAATMSA